MTEQELLVDCFQRLNRLDGGREPAGVLRVVDAGAAPTGGLTPTVRQSKTVEYVKCPKTRLVLGAAPQVGRAEPASHAGAEPVAEHFEGQDGEAPAEDEPAGEPETGDERIGQHRPGEGQHGDPAA